LSASLTLDAIRGGLRQLIIARLSHRQGEAIDAV
jgi:hypothetical protein